MLQRRSSLFVILTALLLLVPMALAQDGMEVAPPRVIDTNPLPGEELSLDSAVKFTFDRQMDTSETSTTVDVIPEIDGSLSWEDNGQTLVFDPTENYERDSDYIFSVEAIAVDETPMAEPYTLTLKTVGYIEISDVIPQDNTSNVEVDATISVIFNRPVVPLLTLEEQGDLPSPIDIEPAVDGSGEWLNTSIYIFRPDEDGLAGGTQYTVTVEEGLAALDGSILDEAFSFSFTTAPPELFNLEIFPQGTTVPLEPEFLIDFTQPMDTATENGIRLEDNLGQPVELNYEWADNRRSVTARPVEMLELESFYEIIVDDTVLKSESGADLLSGIVQSFQTVPYPAILRTEPSNGSTNADPYGGFRIYFSAPVDQDSLVDKVTIDPEPWREFETYYYEYDNRYSLLFDTEPSTTYTITIAPGITDPYGNVIEEETVVTYTTRAYDPDFNLQTPGRVGVYNAYLPKTQFFVTHRNIEELDLNLYDFTLEQLAEVNGPRGYSFFDEYIPLLSNRIRRWNIPVSAPENQWQYELLAVSEFGESGTGNVTCVGAAEPRLVAGMTAEVSDDDPSPLNLRSEPNLAGEILGEYEPGVQVQVLSGPICSDSYWWWEVYVEGTEVEGWMAEGNSSIYFLDPVSEVPETALNEDVAALPPGAYLLEVTSPQVPRDLRYFGRHVMIVSTANITMKFSTRQAMAWVTDMSTGAPIEGVPVRFYNEGFLEIGMAVTDADGLAYLNIPALDSLYVTLYSVIDTDEQFAFVTTDFSRGIDPYNFNLDVNYSPDDDTVYVYTDRPIYRPDQPVYYRGVVRAKDDVTYTIMDLEQVFVTIYNSRGDIVKEEFVDLTPYGTFNGQFDIDAEASLGFYRITVGLPDGEGYFEEGSIGFSVAEYRAPEFQVTVTPEVAAVAQGEDVMVEIESRYFFGAPVSNADVRYSVYSNDYYFGYDGPGRWSFIDFNYDAGPEDYYSPAGEEIANGESTTDELGKFFVEVPTDLGEKTQSQEYTIEAVVTDESDQAVAGRATLIVHQGRVYVGLAPEKYVARAEDETFFRVLTVDWDSEPVGGQPVDYRIVRREWSSVQEKDPQGRTVWRWEVEEIDIEDGSITTDDEGRADIPFTPPEGGAYKIYAETRDVDGNRVNSSAFMWVSGRNYIPWRQQNSNSIDLISDADSYTVGDTAEILIASPFQGQHYALITTERGDLMTTEVIPLDTNSYVYQLPIAPEHAPNIFVSVVLVKGLDDTSPFTQFRIGMIQLGVDTERLNLNVEVSADLQGADFAGPGDEVTLNVKTTDWEGNPVKAEVGVGVTDLSVLSIAPPNSQPLMSHFYGQQGLSVRTATPLTLSADQVTQEIIDTIKGGGGGGGELGIFEVRQDFVDTPLWAPSIITDENGEGQVTVTLPDNLTTWRIDARGVTNGVDRQMLVGQTTADFISTKPLLVRPVTPRFMVVGDKLTMGVVINNNTRDEQIVDAIMEGSGFLVSDETPLRQTVTIPAGGRARVNWSVEVLDVQTVDVTFAAINADGSLQDASKPPIGQGDDRLLPVYRFSVRETVGTSGVIESDDAASLTEFVAFPPRITDDSRGDLKVEIDRSLAGPVLDGLTYLRNYPYQCIEQTVSRFLPNVITVRALRELDQSNPELEEQLDVEVNFGLQRLYSQQKVDGGWGWFPRDESNALTTSYALIGLVEARDAGYTVEERVIERARTFLRTWLLRNGGTARTVQDWELNRRAFVLFAMARAGEPNASMASVLYDDREHLNLDAKAFLGLTMLMIDPADARLDTIVSDFTNQAVLSATGVHWDDRPDHYNWTTNTRSTALILMTMIRADASTQLLTGAVRWLMVAREADAWETTQETAWAIMALTDWMVDTGELDADYTFNVRLNEDVLEFEDNVANEENVKEREQLVVDIENLLLDEANRVILSKTEGPGNLYYRVYLNAYLNVPDVEAQSRGIIINRKYYRGSDPDKTAIDTAEVGEEITVELTIIAPRNLHYVVIEDPLPAGAEGVDPNLLTTSVGSARPELERDDPLSRGWGWWWFSQTEFRDEKVVMYATYLPRGTYTYKYTIRTGLAGEYNVIPPTGQEFYFPEVYGRGDGMLFTILPASEAEPVGDEESTSAMLVE
ncbi:MAG: Ig-like domain-containing protein [Chloroflexi bacterium]|nr:Ig-like domain-containing protein [Chloroflexota bacterium]